MPRTGLFVGGKTPVAGKRGKQQSRTEANAAGCELMREAGRIQTFQPIMLVFREDRSQSNAGELISKLRGAVGRGDGVSALILGGMLESALADPDAGDYCVAAAITDALADALARGETVSPAEIRERLDQLDASRAIEYSAPEGFAYYDLHPLQYLAVGEASVAAEPAAVIGIRSIGSTLSACVGAGLRRRGVKAERITVRPSGHAFDRRTRFGLGQQAWVQRHREAGSRFLVADEGPGLSGSSFLSVGDALIAAGVPRESITFLCSADPDVAQLRAPDGVRRWSSFHSVIVPPRSRAWEQEAQDWGGGLWRHGVFQREEEWPAAWVQFERKKFLLAGAAHLVKFEGLGHFGEQAKVRATLLADEGFSPQVEPMGDGYLRYRRLGGSPASRLSLCPALLERMAQYLAFRARALAADQVNVSALETMLRCNVEEQFGCSVRGHPLFVERPACVDGRMLAHEWIESPQGWMKVDGVGHGDDHFYPGSADIAWDLAGAIVEWEMNSDAAEHLVGRYGQLTADQVNGRLPGWKLAYATFRMAYCKMAAEALAGTPEASRLDSEYRRYRAQVRRMLSADIPETQAAPPTCVGASQKL